MDEKQAREQAKALVQTFKEAKIDITEDQAYAMIMGQQDGAADQNMYLWLPGTSRKAKKPDNMVELPAVPRSSSALRQGTIGPESSLGVFDYDYSVGGGKTNVNDVMNWLYDPQKLKEITDRMKEQGYDVSSFDNIEKAWAQAVQRSSDAFMTSGEKLKVSPWEMLDLAAPPPDQRGGPWRGLEFDHTTNSVDMAQMAPETARGIITKALSDAIGRAPTSEEIEDFASRANAIVSANPQRTETTAHMEWDPQANGGQGDYVQTGQTSRQIGPSAEDVGNMVQQEAVDTAQSNPEYGAYQAATTYTNALMQAILSPGA